MELNKIYSLDELLKDESTPPPQLIGEGILPSNSLLLIAGAKKARKTFLVNNLGIALASGNGFAGFKITKSCKVLIFSAEGGYYPNRDRIQTMCKNINSDVNLNLHVCFDSRLKLDNNADYISIENMIKEFSPDVLIIDPFIKFHTSEENSATDMGIILQRLRNLIEDYGLSIILVHHLGKDSSHGARGSSAILGEYDSCITLTKEGSDNKSLNKIEFDLRHAPTPDPRKLLFNNDTFWFEEEESELAKLLKKHGSMDKKTLVELSISNAIYSQSAAYKAIDREVNRGRISLSENGLYYVEG